MSNLNNIVNIPIDLIFVSNYYDKLLFTHPKYIKLLCMFIIHIILLFTLYIAPLLYNNIYFNVFYVCLIIAMVCGWIVFNGECWINLWEKKILNSQYKPGDNLDVNPGIDLLSKYIIFPIVTYFEPDKKMLINEEHYSYCKSIRYKTPLLIPLIALILFMWTRFKFIPLRYKTIIIFLFIMLLVIAELKWKAVDKTYK